MAELSYKMQHTYTGEKKNRGGLELLTTLLFQIQKSLQGCYAVSTGRQLQTLKES